MYLLHARELTRAILVHLVEPEFEAKDVSIVGVGPNLRDLDTFVHADDADFACSRPRARSS